MAVIAGHEETEQDGASAAVVFRLKLDRDCKSYSVAELLELVVTLQAALRESDVVRLGKREGCVEIGLRLSAEKADRLLWLVRSGALEELGVIDGDLIPADDEAAFLTSLQDVKDEEHRLPIGRPWLAYLTTDPVNAGMVTQLAASCGMKLKVVYPRDLPELEWGLVLDWDSLPEEYRLQLLTGGEVIVVAVHGYGLSEALANLLGRCGILCSRRLGGDDHRFFLELAGRSRRARAE
jgi:hypothetical protein